MWWVAWWGLGVVVVAAGVVGVVAVVAGAATRVGLVDDDAPQPAVSRPAAPMIAGIRKLRLRLISSTKDAQPPHSFPGAAIGRGPPSLSWDETRT
jgi:hypothetical protein